MAQTISPDAIREAAYHLWVSAGQPDGQDQQFWFQAEASLAKPAPKKRAAAKKAPVKKAASVVKKPTVKSAAPKSKVAAKKTAKS